MSITKTKTKNKDGVYQYRVRVSYTTDEGCYKQREKSVFGLQQSKDEEYLLKQACSAPTVTNITVNQLVTEYFNVKKYEVRESTIRTSQSRIDNYIIPIIGNYSLNKLTPKIITDWKIKIEQVGLSHVTKKHAYGELRGLLNWAVKMDYIPSSPLSKVGNFKTGELKENKIQVYSAEEFKKYISVAKSNAIKNEYYDFYVFFCIAFYTGMRKGEIHALRWSNLESSSLKVKTSIQQKLKGGYLETPPKNSSSIRDIRIPTPLENILKEHKKRQEQQSSFDDNKYICGYDKPLSDTSIDLKNRSFAKEADLHRIRIHDFRHTHASILIDKGIVITEVARRLGHSDIKETLNTYAHFFPKQEEKAIEILNNLGIF